MDAPRRHTLIDLALLALVALAVFWSCNLIVGARRLRATTLNDSVGYYATARTFARTGHLESNIVYPSTLSQKTTKTYLYMPGFYVYLAIIFKLLGTGVPQALLASCLAGVTATCCTYLVALRFYDRRTALLAAALFIAYPPILFFSASAMSELAVVSAAIFVFAVFVYLPTAWMPIIGPVLLAVAFVFRETCALWVLPMLAVLWYRCREQQGMRAAGIAARAAALGLGSVVLLALVYLSPVASGRPSLFKLDIFYGEENGLRTIYGDAVAAAQAVPPGAWRAKLSHRFGRNVHQMFQNIAKSPWRTSMPNAMIVPLLLVVPVGFAWGAWKRDPLAIGAGALVLVTVVLLCLLYLVPAYTSLRITMLAAPLMALLYARVWMALVVPTLDRIPAANRLWPYAVAIILVGGVAVQQAAAGFGDMLAYDDADGIAEGLIVRLRHDDRTTLVGPAQLCVPYVARHYPVTYSFSPANRRSLELLCARYCVTTLLFDPNEPAVPLSEQDIVDQGLRRYCRVRATGGVDYIVFRRPSFPAEESSWDADRVEEIQAGAVQMPKLKPATQPGRKR
jgi:4-amino-4-deoxy-L-arabinose transferase-like glycosyltransferase